MNTYAKYCPNVFVAKCEEKHTKGDVIEVHTKYGKVNEHIVYNLVAERNGFFYYSIVRADGYNVQERARRKAERYEHAAENALNRSHQYFERSEKDSAFLSLGEPIKVGHHSEHRHRKMIEDAWRNTGKAVAEQRKADEYREKAATWEAKEDTINLSMPESLDYYTSQLKDAQEYHAAMKAGKIERTHAFSLTYAKKRVNELEKQVKRAQILWGE